MLTQIVWRSHLPMSDCERRLNEIASRRRLAAEGKSSVTAAGGPSRSFRLQATDTPMHVLFSPYFHGSLIDKHGATDIRGRLLPSPLVQLAMMVGAFGAVLSSMAIIKGVPLSASVMATPLVSLILSVGILAIAAVRVRQA